MQGEQRTFIARDKDGICGTLTVKMTRDPKVGVIGFYECLNNEKASRQLFDFAIDFFLQRNVKKVIGPMSHTSLDGYRYCLESGETPNFLFEPTHQSFYPKLWEQYGFKPFIKYTSFEIFQDEQIEKKWFDAYLNALERGCYVKKIKSISDPLVIKHLISDSQPVFLHQEVLFSWLNVSSKTMRKDLNKIIKQGLSYFIYNNNGKLIGAILAGSQGKKLHVYDARVHRAYQKQGVAGALFYQLAKVASSRSLESCLLCMIREDLSSLLRTNLLKANPFRHYRLYQFNLP